MLLIRNSVQEFLKIEACLKLLTFFRMLTRSVKFNTFNCHILKRCLEYVIHQIDRKWKLAPFSKIYGKI